MARKKIDKEMIVKEAIRLIEEQGIESLTLAMLAKQLGIKPPSLYNHINGLQDVKKQIALLGMSVLKEKLMVASIGKAGKDAILSLSFAYLDYVRDNTSLYMATMSDFHENDPELILAGNEIVTIIQSALAMFGFQEEEEVHIIRGLRSICHGFASLEQQEGFQLQIEKNKSFEHLVKTYVNGLHPSL